MFDPETSNMLRSAPAVPGLNPDDIPQLITRHYATLVSARLRGASDEALLDDAGWTLERIADTYELITSTNPDPAVRRASAFVAATAHQVLSRRKLLSAVEPSQTWSVNREGVDPGIAAALLFLAAEQYADAHEAASAIILPKSGILYEARILAEHIRDLARGQLSPILERAGRWRRTEQPNFTIQTRALVALLETLITGIEIFAAQAMSLPELDVTGRHFATASEAFSKVLNLSTNTNNTFVDDLNGELFTTYAGPRHLAALLLAADRGMRDAALTRLPPPEGANESFWLTWLQNRAQKCPFVWPNHREAIAKGFHQTGKSAVVVLPTGAGKTTVSSLKIAGVLARKKKVVFLAPTHALVEQLTLDLQEMFPQDVLGSIVSSDFDLLLMADTQLKEIEVMTPEGFLAMLSFAPEAFTDVGLLVFDECHLLSPQSGKIRRALDGMLCLLAFNRLVPKADMLFLSAMLKNGEEFATWVGQLTGRECVSVDLLWKPSRQARGVVIYQDNELSEIMKQANAVQTAQDAKANKKAKGLRVDAQKELRASPCAIWGLQHNWLSTDTAYCSFTLLSDDKVKLAGDLKYGFRLLPNANQIAASLAVTAARSGLKTIVFVNTKSDAVSTAKEISSQLGEALEPTEAEQERWDALKAELGGLKHSLLGSAASAVPHNSAMLHLERDLAERMFRRSDGAKVIVATPTLAQGLNLPAQLAILAGDKRANVEQGGRENLEAHEILNAAARAGRAGHLANGIVLLIPEPIISFTQGQPLTTDVVEKLRSVLPENDRCVTISDPLEIVLDRLMEGKLLDREVRYTINRMAAMVEGAGDTPALFDLQKSFAAYAAKAKSQEQQFNNKVAFLKAAIDKDSLTEELDLTVVALASQSGLPGTLLKTLKTKIQAQVGALPASVGGWVGWVLEWLATDQQARELLLSDVAGAIASATKTKKPDKGKAAKTIQKKEPMQITPAMVSALLPGVIAWIEGKPLREIEIIMGGDPDSDLDSMRICPRARELARSVIPRGLSFVMGLIARVVEDIDPFDQQKGLSRELVELISTAVRRGFDTPEKLTFANENKTILSRAQIHAAFAQQPRGFSPIEIDDL